MFQLYLFRVCTVWQIIVVRIQDRFAIKWKTNNLINFGDSNFFDSIIIQVVVNLQKSSTMNDFLFSFFVSDRLFIVGIPEKVSIFIGHPQYQIAIIQWSDQRFTFVQFNRTWEWPLNQSVSFKMEEKEENMCYLQ